MNAAEKIVESYFRYIKELYTKSNLQGEGQTELDVVAVNPLVHPPIFYHIESSVSISGSYSKITNKEYNREKAKQRGKKAGQRTTAGFFIEKFNSENMKKTYKKLGITKKQLNQVVVAWKFDPEAKKALKDNNIECLTMKDICQELGERLAEETKNMDSDILRMIQLFVRSEPKIPKIFSVSTLRKRRKAKISKGKRNFYRGSKCQIECAW